LPANRSRACARAPRALGAALLLTVLLAACGGPAPAPLDVPATTTALAGDNATVVARQRLVPTFVAGRNATATVQTSDFRRIRALLQVRLADGGPATPPGAQVRLTVSNADTSAHQVVVRLYDRGAPLSTNAYSVAALQVAAGATASTLATARVPFATVAAQVLQIDGVWDFGPPGP